MTGGFELGTTRYEREWIDLSCSTLICVYMSKRSAWAREISGGRFGGRRRKGNAAATLLAYSVISICALPDVRRQLPSRRRGSANEGGFREREALRRHRSDDAASRSDPICGFLVLLSRQSEA